MFPLVVPEAWETYGPKLVPPTATILGNNLPKTWDVTVSGKRVLDAAFLAFDSRNTMLQFLPFAKFDVAKAMSIVSFFSSGRRESNRVLCIRHPHAEGMILRILNCGRCKCDFVHQMSRAHDA